VGNTPIEDAPPPQPDWHTVVFEDLRFNRTPGASDRGGNPLSAWAYIGANNEVEGMFMSGREQK